MFGVRVSRLLEAHLVGLDPDGAARVLLAGSNDGVVNARFRYAWASGSVAHANAENAFLVRVTSSLELGPMFFAPVLGSVEGDVGAVGLSAGSRDASIHSGRGEAALFGVSDGEQKIELPGGCFYLDGEVAVGRPKAWHEEPTAVLDAATREVVAAVPRLMRPQVSRAGDLLVLCERAVGVAVVDVRARRLVALHDVPVGGNCRAFVHQGQLVGLTGGERGALSRFDLVSGKEVGRTSLPPGWPRDVHAIDGGFVVTHEDGVFLVDDAGALHPLAPVDLDDNRLVHADGHVFAGIAKAKQGSTLVVVSMGRTACVSLARDPEAVFVRHGCVALELGGHDRLLAVARVASVLEGDLELEVTSLRIADGKPRRVEERSREVLGQLVRPKSRAPVKKAEELARGLVEAGLLDGPVTALRRTLLRTFKAAADVDETAAARLLAAVHGTAGGQTRGFVSHDWRFGQETDDVVAELDAGLDGEPVRFAQARSDGRGLEIEVRAGARAERHAVGVESLLDVVAFLNAELARHGARRRIRGLETNGDWLAFVTCDDERAALLEKAGVRLL